MVFPNVLQLFFADDKDGHELAHGYYLNAAWVADLCDRYGALLVGECIHRALESKRKACIKRYGSEWGKAAVKPKKPGCKRRKEKE